MVSVYSNPITRVTDRASEAVIFLWDEHRFRFIQGGSVFVLPSHGAGESLNGFVEASAAMAFRSQNCLL